MGIKGFNKWLKNKYYDSKLDYIPARCYDHVYVDLNFMLHRLAATTHDEQILLRKVFTSIDNILINTPPLKSITLASDGSACYAKILLQRERRLQMALSKKFDPHYVDSLHFSPGTTFMLKFEEEIKKYIKNKLKDGSTLKYHISLSSETGESEIKICKFILLNHDNYPLDSHLIISNDADIVVIASSMLTVNNIFILIQKDRGQGNYIISIDTIIDHHMEIYGYNICKKLDFALISLLNENDYLPGLGFINFDSLWNAYKKSINNYETIVNMNNTINVQIFRKYLRSLINTIPTQFSKNVRIESLMWDKIKTYLDGLSWCMTLYSTSVCTMYDYMCHHEKIHPCALLYYLELNNVRIIKAPNSNCQPIQDLIYAVLITPKIAKSLILPQYHHIIETQLGHLYEEELCGTCVQLRNAYGNIMRDYVGLEKTDINKKKLKKEVVTQLDTLKKHKKTHVIVNPVEFINNLVKIISQ